MINSNRFLLHRAADLDDDAESEAEVERILAQVPRGLYTLGTDVNGWTPMHYAAWHGRERIVKLLLDHGSAIDALSIYCETPMQIAIRSSHDAVVMFLLENGANPQIYKEEGSSPLKMAIQRRSPNLTRLLLDHGAQINVVHVTVCQSYMHIVSELACRLRGWSDCSMIEIARLLLERGADIDAVDTHGDTPLHYAVGEGSIYFAEFLIENGANMAAKDYTLDKPRDLARRDTIHVFESVHLRRLNTLARSRRHAVLVEDDNENDGVGDGDGFRVHCLKQIILGVTDARYVENVRLVCKAWRRLADSVLGARPDVFFAVS
jgi:ankyrin repeat protein